MSGSCSRWMAGPSTGATFQADRTRQNRLVAAGYTVLRFTWADLTLRPDDVGTQVAATLARLRVAAGGPTR